MTDSPQHELSDQDHLALAEQAMARAATRDPGDPAHLSLAAVAVAHTLIILARGELAARQELRQAASADPLDIRNPLERAPAPGMADKRRPWET